MRLMSFLFPSQGTGSKDADMVTDELLVNDLLTMNGEGMVLHCLDNWSGNRNRCVMFGYLQFTVDIGITKFNLHLLRWPNDSKDESDRY